ncbi:MAG TPA: hypothetical protein VJA40_02045 [archaeon]|nr:hypothetical protein [archaeon]
MAIVYACTGSCNGVVSREQFNAGTIACGSPWCEKHAQPFEKRTQCAECSAWTGKHLKAKTCGNCVPG